MGYIDRARGLGVDLVAFPELAVPGYPPEDLLLKPDFVQANISCLHQIAAAARGITAISVKRTSELVFQNGFRW